MPKSDIDKQIEERIEAFLGELSDLVRAAALESVGKALGGEVPIPYRKSATRTPRPTSVKRGSAARSAKRRGGKRHRRTAAEIETTKSDIVTFLKANPGSGMEQVSTALKLATKEVRGPMLKLIAVNKVRMKGQKRAAKYSVKGR